VENNSHFFKSRHFSTEYIFLYKFSNLKGRSYNILHDFLMNNFFTHSRGTSGFWKFFMTALTALKVPKHEIFDFFFFAQKNPFGPLIHNLKQFRI
jgi:hypothetical protein